MKTATALIALLLSAQVAADCPEIEFEGLVPGDTSATVAELSQTPETAVTVEERREAYLDCLKPEPFVQERIVIDIENISADFRRESERFIERDNAVAVN